MHHTVGQPIQHAKIRSYRNIIDRQTSHDTLHNGSSVSRGACQQSVIGYRIQKHRFSRSLCSLQTVYTIPVGCLVTNLSMTISNYLCEQVIAIAQLMRLDKPWGTVLLLWPTLWALWLASHGLPSLKVIAVFLLGGVIMRACGCVMNDWFDQDIDARVCRTKTRPIASGK